MTRNQLKKETIDYVKYVVNQDSEYPFEAWVANETEICEENENELAEISYHAQYLAWLLNNIQISY